MTALRCTQKLLKALKATPSEPAAPPHSRLGDWSAKLAHFGRKPCVVACCELTRLGLVIDAAPYATLPGRLVADLIATLEWLEIPPQLILEEVAAMNPLYIAVSNSRSVLGTLNDYTHYTERKLEMGVFACPELTMNLAQIPIKVIGYEFPGDATRRAFGLPPFFTRRRAPYLH